jgi:hypothetical protein
MSPTPKRDPNAPPDPTELREIPDQQHPAGQDVNPHNPVTPGPAPPPDIDDPTPPWQPGDGKPPWAGGKPPATPAATPVEEDEEADHPAKKKK